MQEELPLATLQTAVLDCLHAAGADSKIVALWQEVFNTEIQAEEDEDEFY